MKDGSEEKMMLLTSCVDRPKQTKVIERKLNFYF